MWWWILIWIVLMCGAFAFLVALGVRLFHKGLGLARQLGESAETFAAVSEQLEALSRTFAPAPSSVFDDPAHLRRRREAEKRLAARRRDGARRRAARSLAGRG